MRRVQHQQSGTNSRRAFTLIELLVVVAIIALLISILLPSLGAARKQARAVKCAANLHSVGQAFQIYLAENKAAYPPSYIYASDGSGGYDFNNQPNDHPFGYLHWSWSLFNRGAAKWDAFMCPEMSRGGNPRTNPGGDTTNWENGQANQLGQGPPSPLEDKQAPRIAYTTNAAVVPRNKFTTLMSGGPRINKCVQERDLVSPRGVILATEFSRNWFVATTAQTTGLIKSHRPVCAFYSYSGGTNEYVAPPSGGFHYGPQSTPDYGLRPLADIEKSQVGLFDTDTPEINLVGRHHPGGDKYGGTANFLYIDGHVARTTVLDTMNKREWGNKYYSLSGPRTEVDLNN